jgi:ribA/ribD-fused uncharacterized protein
VIDGGGKGRGGAVPAAITEFDHDTAFLSNFAPSPVVWEGVAFPTVEHAFQAAKTLDPVERRRIAALPHPADAKAAGRRVALRPDWEAVKTDIMAALLALKFSDPQLRAQLLATGEADLIEGNHWFDRVWGQCPLGVGENRLGRLLMAERRRIRVTVGTFGD